MSLSSLLYTIIPAIFLIAIIIIEYSGKVKPNLQVGIPILAVGVALIAVGIVIGNPPLIITGFLIFVFSLVFIPRRRRWL